MRNYDVRVGPKERMLGRSVVPIGITHRALHNPSRRLWVEPLTGIVLKDVLLAPDGRQRSCSEYTQLRVMPQPVSRFDIPSAARNLALYGPASFGARASSAQVEQESGRPVFLPRHVPPGYRITLYGVMVTGSGRLMPAVRYSDGFAAFTIFQRGWGAGPGHGPGIGGRGFGRRGPGGGAGEFVGAFYPTPGYCDEKMNFFRLTLLAPPVGRPAASPDDDEDIRVRRFSLAEIRSMIARGEIDDLKTVAGLALL